VVGARGAVQAVRGSALTVVDAGLPPALLPLAWLVGAWEGDGVVGYPSMAEDRPFAQRVEVSQDGRAFLLWHSRTWALDGEGGRGEPLATEVGFWRPGPGGPGEVELLLTHATGILELYAGRVDGGRIELASDVVMRSPAAAEYTAGHRLYGHVDGDLLWAMDMAAVGHAMTPHASARLHRVRPA
jgi:hypothetical protein